MTDFAAVSGQVNANAGPRAAKGSAAKGAGTGLDGAFASIFDAAGAKSAGAGVEETKVKLPTPAKPGAQTLDTAQAGEATTQIDPQAVLADADVTTEATTDPDASAKPRKPGTRRKNDTDQADPQAVSLLASFASVVPNAQQTLHAPQGKQQTDSAVAGIQSVKTAASITAGVAVADSAALAPKPEADGAALAPKPEADSATGKDAKPVVVANAQQQTTAPPANSVVVDSTGQQGGRASDSQNGSGAGSSGAGGGKDQNASTSPKLADNDDLSPTVTAGSLQDIMQSLPPVLQSQLGVADMTGASVVSGVSTGDQLSNQVIDMGVSGQWIDRMAQEIATLASGTGHSSFQLSPPNLGKIQVDLMQSGDVTNVRILTETDEATRRLRDGQGALEANARVASLSLGSVSIEKTSASQDARDQNGRQNPDSAANGQQQQQASAQAQSQSGQNRGGAGINRGGFAAVMGQDQEAGTGLDAGTDRVSDPGVRFA